MNHATDLGSPAWGQIASRSLDEVKGYILAPYREGEPFVPDSFGGVFRDASKVARILDFGCGVGRNAVVLRERCDELALYDIPQMVAHCQSLGSDAKIRITSDWAEVLSGTYDLTVAAFVFQHIESIDVFHYYVESLSRVTDYLHIRGRHWRDGPGRDNVLKLILDTGFFELRTITPGKDKVLNSIADQDVHFEALLRTRCTDLHRSRNAKILDRPEPIRVRLEDFDLLFDRQALGDERGIGRVSRNLLAELQRMQTSSREGAAHVEVPEVQFFSSVHWCPDTLVSPSAILIHDVIPLKYPYAFAGSAEEWQARLMHVAKQADCIFTFSRSSALDIQAFFGVSPSRIHIVPNGVRPLPDAGSGSVRRPTPPYLVYVGTDEPHKNAEFLLDVLERPELATYSLAMAGYTGALPELVRSRGLSERVICYGKLSDTDLAYLLRGSHALLCPSLYEGFGLPPLEAGWLGVPAVCSDRPAMNECLRGATVLVDPHDPGDWAAQILRLRHKEFRSERVHAIQRKARGYTFPLLAEGLLRGLRQSLFGDGPATCSRQAATPPANLSYRKFDPPLMVQAIEKYEKDPLRAELYTGHDSPVLLFSTMAGPWRKAFSNWVGMARRFQYDFAILGRNQGYLKHYSKCRAAHDFLKTLPEDQIVCQLDSTDAFICARPEALYERFLAHDSAFVIGAESGPNPENSWDGNKPWSWSNAGFVIGEAGQFVKALSDILSPTEYNLDVWDAYGHFCDQHALNLHFLKGSPKVEACLNTSRNLVANWSDDIDGHSTSATMPDTCAFHFYGGQFRAYDRVGASYGLEPL